VSDFAAIVRHYGIPARDPGQTRPEVAGLATRRHASRRGRQSSHDRSRRLAYLDDVFPWKRSGFRYREAYAIWELRPDTLFFSLWDLTDPFPAPVHRLTDFPVIASNAGVTDAYGVFLLFLEGLCGLRPSNNAPPHPFEGPDLSAAFRVAGVRLHGTIYPGGGYAPTPECLARVRALSMRMETTFSYVPEVLEQIPAVTRVDQAFTDTSFYAPTTERWRRRRPVTCLFAADGSKRKGVDEVIAAFRDLSPEAFHLHLAGPHERRAGELAERIASFHGWLSPEALRDLHALTHVFVSPVRQEEASDGTGAQPGLVDGFPTQAATDAMSSGCLLVSSNPAQDHRVLTPGVHYVEVAPVRDSLRAALLEVAADLDRARAIAEAGSAQVRAKMDVRPATAVKLRHMGLLGAVSRQD